MKRVWLLLVGLMALEVYGAGPKYLLPLTEDGAEVEFLAVGRPSAIKIKGEVAEPAPGDLKGEFVIDKFRCTGKAAFRLGALKTGIELRDRHMKEKYLETGQFPQAVFELSELVIPQSFVEEGFTAEAEPFKGKLTLKDKTAPVEGTVSMKGNALALEMEYRFPVKLTDHKVEIPSFMGVTVAETVDVRVRVKVKPEKQL